MKTIAGRRGDEFEGRVFASTRSRPRSSSGYVPTNSAPDWRGERVEVSALVDDAFDERCFGSCVAGSLRVALGLLRRTVGIPGAPRHDGVRLRYRV